MRGPTKAQLEEENERLRDENFAVTFVLQKRLDEAAHSLGVIQHEGWSEVQQATIVEGRTEVFYFARARKDGGYIWLREFDTEGRPTHFTAMGLSRFVKLCDDKANVGHYEFRTAQQWVNAAQQEAITREAA